MTVTCTHDLHSVVAWSVPVSPNVLVSDPYSSAAVVFVPSSARLGSSDCEPIHSIVLSFLPRQL